MQRRPRDKSDGIFAGGLGLDCAFQGIVIAILTLVSYFIGHNLEYGTMDISQVIADPTLGREGMTMAFLTLSMVEMFHSFNMRSRRQSIFTIRHQNVWLWGSLALSLLLTWCVIEIDPIANAFGFAELSLSTYGVAMLLAFMVIPINEVYKAVMRRVERGRNVVAPGDAA